MESYHNLGPTFKIMIHIYALSHSDQKETYEVGTIILIS